MTAAAALRPMVDDLSARGALEPYQVLLDVKDTDVADGKFKQRMRVMVDGERKGAVRVFDQGEDKVFVPIKGSDISGKADYNVSLINTIGEKIEELRKQDEALNYYQIAKLASMQEAILLGSGEIFWVAFDADGEPDFDSPMLTEYIAERIADNASEDLIGGAKGRENVQHFVQEKLVASEGVVDNAKDLEGGDPKDVPSEKKIVNEGALVAVYPALEKEMIVNQSYFEDARLKDSPWHEKVHAALLPQQVGSGKNGERQAKASYGDDYGFKVFKDAQGHKFLRVGAFDGVGSAGEIQDMAGEAMENILLMSELAGLSIRDVAQRGDKHAQFMADVLEGAFNQEASKVRLDQARAAGVVFDVFENGEVRGVNKGDFKLFVLGDDAEGGMKWGRLNKTQRGKKNRILGAFGDGEPPLKFSYKLQRGETLVALSDGVYKLFENSREIGRVLRGWQNNPDLKTRFPDPAKYLLYFAETTRANAIFKTDWQNSKSIRDAYSGDYEAYMNKCNQVMKDAPGVAGKRKSDDMNCLIVESPVQA